MLNKDQVSSASEALLEPHRQAQKRTQERQSETQRLLMRRARYAWCGFAGYLAGAILGKVIFNAYLVGSMIGLGLGMLVGDFFRRRAA